MYYRHGFRCLGPLSCTVVVLAKLAPLTSLVSIQFKIHLKCDWLEMCVKCSAYLYYPNGTPSSGVTANMSNKFQILETYTELVVSQDTIHTVCIYTH